jgi:hypothetical protein
MSTPPLNPKYARRHARAARTVGYTPPQQWDREGMLTFVRDTAVFFASLRTAYHDSEWGEMFQDIFEDSRFGEIVDDIFNLGAAP